MQPLRPVDGESRPGLAIGGGILAGLATLALIAFGLWLVGRSDNPTDAGGRVGFGQPIAATAVLPGDCVDLTAGAAGIPSGLVLVDCDDAHDAQVTARIDHPEEDGPFPGVAEMAGWIARQCDAPTDEFIGAAILTTTLEGSWLLPDAGDWTTGETSAVCHVANFDGTPLTVSVEGRADDHLRGEEIQVSRLIVGDCFAPAADLDAYGLNSNSPVVLAGCDDVHNGIFFGRDTLDAGSDAPFPGEADIGAETSRRCALLFNDTFGVDADGFNYRYWRPNEQSWDRGDRSILCAVLDSQPLTEPFDPTLYDQFFGLDMATCFNLGPEETGTTLRLDDRVRILDCSEPHTGQMIGGGELESGPDDPFPTETIKQLAGDECERLFLDFMGISPYASEFGKFPFWFPKRSAWEDGDRRYACAIVETEPRSGSLEGAAR